MYTNDVRIKIQSNCEKACRVHVKKSACKFVSSVRFLRGTTPHFGVTKSSALAVEEGKAGALSGGPKG